MPFVPAVPAHTGTREAWPGCAARRRCPSARPSLRFALPTAAASSFAALQPTQTFRGGQGALPTALRGVVGETSMFVSGDKEGAMLLWDLRTPTNVGAFGSAGSK